MTDIYTMVSHVTTTIQMWTYGSAGVAACIKVEYEKSVLLLGVGLVLLLQAAAHNVKRRMPVASAFAKNCIQKVT